MHVAIEEGQFDGLSLEIQFRIMTRLLGNMEGVPEPAGLKPGGADSGAARKQTA
jgi:hypothetical protein